MSSGGLGFTIGKQQQGLDQQGREVSTTASTVGALSGNVTLIAGNQYTQTGSHVLAAGINGGGDVTITAQNVAITEARESAQQQTDSWAKQSGLTVAISSPVISSLQTIDQMAKASRHTSDKRMQALAGASAALAGASAMGAIQQGQGSTTTDGKTGQIATGQVDANALDKVGGVSVNVSVGSSKSSSHSTQSS
ncbi:hypothetical protein HZU77_015320 [Neisseriaceae bacterium TC5R-5]|nr:hypothetical protein [Neisseriaceae bacterium TC5R-5]